MVFSLQQSASSYIASATISDSPSISYLFYFYSLLLAFFLIHPRVPYSSSFSTHEFPTPLLAISLVPQYPCLSVYFYLLLHWSSYISQSFLTCFYLSWPLLLLGISYSHNFMVSYSRWTQLSSANVTSIFYPAVEFDPPQGKGGKASTIGISVLHHTKLNDRIEEPHSCYTTGRQESTSQHLGNPTLARHRKYGTREMRATNRHCYSANHYVRCSPFKTSF